MTTEQHVTTRRCFIAGAGFSGVSLYGIWAAYGAVPGPLALLGLGGQHQAADTHGMPSAASGNADAGHGGHGASPAGPSPDEFRRMTAEFIERYRLPDGSVHPRRLVTQPATGHDVKAGQTDIHASMGHGASAREGHGDTAAPAANGLPLDVLMSAGKYYYLPQALRLDAGQPYRFRMMALDASHGASIQFGQGARMLRLRPGRLIETQMTFHQPGRYLMICTLYCGAGHDMMQATIEVA